MADAGEPAARGFRLSTRALFLTYAHTGETTPQQLLDWLTPVVAPYTIDSYSIGREKYKEGEGYHIHAYIKLDRKCNIRSPTKLDIPQLPTPHGNYQPGKSKHIKYSQKDGDFITNLGEVGSYIGKARAGDYDGALKDFTDAHAMQYVLNKSKVESNLRALGAPSRKTLPLYGPWSEALSRGTADWDRTSKALVLLGPSGLGKTQWALAQFESPLLISHSDGLKALRPDHDAIIFDDMSFSHWPRTSAIHLTDLECDRQLNVKFGCVTVPARLPRIITSNSSWDELFPVDEPGAIKRRCKVVDLFPEQMAPIFNM